MKTDGPVLVALIVLLSMFGPISTDMFLAGLPDMIRFYDTNETVITMIIYGFMVSLAVSVLILGPLSDKYGRKPVLVASMVLYTVTSLLCSVAPTVWLLILFRVLQAVGGAGALSISMALIKDCFTGQRMRSVLTIIAVIGVIGPIASPIIGALIMEALDWRATFWAPAAVSVICLAMALAMPETLHDDERYTGSIRHALGGLKSVFDRRGFMLFTVMSSIFFIPFFAYLSVSSYIYQEMFGMTSIEYSLMLGATMTIGIVAMLILTRVIARIGNIRALYMFLGFGVISAILMLTVGGSGPYMFMLAVLFTVFITMCTRPFGFALLLSQFKGDNGSVSSILNFFTFMLGFVGMVIASMPWANFVTGIGFCVVLSIVIYIVAWILLKKYGEPLEGLEGI